MAKTIIRVPASSANIGPGFDVLGIGLNLFLTLELEVDALLASTDKFNCSISYEGEGSENVPLASDRNLITKTALFVLRCNGIKQFPKTTKVHVINPIPLGRGLGSSGAAVVAGVMLANQVGKLGFSKQRCLDYCLMIERHPDNITAAMIGGFTGSYLRKLTEHEVALVHQPLDDMLAPHAPAIQAPLDIGTHVKYNWNPAIKCIAIIPQFEVPTSESRHVLPTEYSRPDVIFNLQRLAVLTTAVGAEKPDPQVIYNSMQDKLHQPYRKVLIPGLTEILSGFTPQSHAGLLGICLSGAGPTILCLATNNFERIAEDIIVRFKKEGVTCVWKLLEPAFEGATVENL